MSLFCIKNTHAFYMGIYFYYSVNFVTVKFSFGAPQGLPSGIGLSPGAKLIVVKFVQPANIGYVASVYIVVTLFGIVILFNAVQFLNVLLFMVFNSSPLNVTFSKEVQPEKSLPLINVTFFGIFILFKDLHPHKTTSL